MKRLINPPDIGIVKKIINEWVSSYPRITKIYLFGSYVKKNKLIINDIDIAIEISHNESDTASGFWCFEGNKMGEQLTRLLNYKVDLEWVDENKTPTIKKGLEAGNLLIYERRKNWSE